MIPGCPLKILNKYIYYIVQACCVYFVTGKFLLRKFYLGKFRRENSSYGKFLLWKNNVAGNSGMPLSANL